MCYDALRITECKRVFLTIEYVQLRDLCLTRTSRLK